MKSFLTNWPAWLTAALWLLPCAALVATAVDGGDRGLWWWVGQRAWRVAAEQTLTQCGMVAVMGFLLGWLPGVLTGFAGPAWRLMIQGICALPLLLPPFLWAVGWSFLQGRFPRTWGPLFDGKWGLLCAGLASTVPMVLLASSVAVSTVPRAAWEFALTKAGRGKCRALAARRAWPVAAAAALLGAMLGAADAGAGQIMGRHGMAGEVLVSLAIRHDTGEAAAKALASGLLLLPGAALTAWLVAKRWSARGTARSSVRQGAQPVFLRLDWLAALAILLMATLALAVPAAGLATPLQRPRAAYYLADALSLWKSSAGPTLWYSLGSGLIAAAAGWLLACRWARRPWFAAVCLLALAIPSSLRALGWITAGSRLPWVRGLLGSEPGVALALGLQWLPLAALLLSPACANLPASWQDRRLLTGMSRLHYAARVLLPAAAPWLGLATLTCGLFSLADVTSLMLLQPPGAPGFTSHVFAVMDNSPEIIVASLCVALLIAPLTLGMVMLLPLALIHRCRRSP